MPDHDPAARRSVGRIGLWGAPGCGKTTFLAALNIAASRLPPQEFTISGMDGASASLLAENTERLTRDRQFPAITVNEGQCSYLVRIMAKVLERHRFGRQTMTTVPVEMSLGLLGEQGQIISEIPADDKTDDDDMSMPVAEEVVMGGPASGNGLLLLFDPIKERDRSDTFDHLKGALLRIAQRWIASHATPAGQLPHYVAVCFTKFDHPDIYLRAKERGYRNFSVDDPFMFPCVHDELAELFFDELMQSERGNADLVVGALRRYFEPDRVRFFATSAIGFYKNPKVARFEEGDFINTLNREDGGFEIRGAIHPINVIEPLMWICNRLASA